MIKDTLRKVFLSLSLVGLSLTTMSTPALASSPTIYASTTPGFWQSGLPVLWTYFTDWAYQPNIANAKNVDAILANLLKQVNTVYKNDLKQRKHIIDQISKIRSGIANKNTTDAATGMSQLTAHFVLSEVEVIFNAAANLTPNAPPPQSTVNGPAPQPTGCPNSVALCTSIASAAAGLTGDSPATKKAFWQISKNLDKSNYKLENYKSDYRTLMYAVIKQMK